MCGLCLCVWLVLHAKVNTPDVNSGHNGLAIIHRFLQHIASVSGFCHTHIHRRLITHIPKRYKSRACLSSGAGLVCYLILLAVAMCGFGCAPARCARNLCMSSQRKCRNAGECDILFRLRSFFFVCCFVVVVAWRYHISYRKLRKKNTLSTNTHRVALANKHEPHESQRTLRSKQEVQKKTVVLHSASLRCIFSVRNPFELR